MPFGTSSSRDGEISLVTERSHEIMDSSCRENENRIVGDELLSSNANKAEASETELRRSSRLRKLNERVEAFMVQTRNRYAIQENEKGEYESNEEEIL